MQKIIYCYNVFHYSVVFSYGCLAAFLCCVVCIEYLFNYIDLAMYSIINPIVFGIWLPSIFSVHIIMHFFQHQCAHPQGFGSLYDLLASLWLSEGILLCSNLLKARLTTITTISKLPCHVSCITLSWETRLMRVNV